MAAIQILNKETLSERKYLLQNVSFEKADAEGVFHNQEREVYFKPDAVAVLLADNDHKKILLTKQFRLPAFLNGSDSGYLIEACAGIIAEDETPEQTVRREAEEETGYQITDLNRVATAYSSPNGTTELIYLFIAGYDSTGKHSKGGGLKSENESIELVELDFDEAKEKLKLSEFRDLKTILLLQHFFMQ